jgi:hypothetical protein
MVSFELLPLYPWGNIPRYPLDRKLGQTQIPVWTTWRKKKFCPCQELNTRLQVRNATQLKALMQIMYLLSNFMERFVVFSLTNAS